MLQNNIYEQNSHSIIPPKVSDDRLATFKKELEVELEHITSFWLDNAVDFLYGGFIGKMDNHGLVYLKAPKYACLNAGILWSLSAAYCRTPKFEYRNGADRAYEYIEQHFVDHQMGGIFQSVDYLGRPLDKQKSTFTLASTIIGLSEYYLASFTPSSKELAIRLYNALITHGYDEENGGYFDTFEQKALLTKHDPYTCEDVEVKSAKTHLRVLKSFIELYRIWADETLKERINQLIGIFLEKILNPHTWSLHLYFNATWHNQSNVSCFGFNMAASWLLSEAAKRINDYSLLYKADQISNKIVKRAYIAIDKDGALWHESIASAGIVNKEKHGWPQVHTIISLLSTGLRKGELQYINDALKNWNFVKEKIRDHQRGEWFYGVYEDGVAMKNEDKVGAEKCPFYNSFLCIHIINMLTSSAKTMA